MKYLVIFFSLLNLNVFAQDTLILERILPLKYSGNVVVDELEQFYVVKRNEIVKLNNKGELLNRYSQNVFGDIQKIDVSNPLEILVYYQNQSQIVFLDNTLSEQRTPLNLNQLGYNNVVDVANSQYKGFWLYDSYNFELVKLNVSSQKRTSSGNINWLANKELDITEISEINNFVYALDSSKGLVMFDNLANYMKFFPFNSLLKFDVVGDVIYGFNGKKVFTYNTKLYARQEYSIKHSNVNTNPMMHIFNKKVYMFFANKIEVYNFPLK